MSWAKPQVEKLKEGETVKFRPHGHSMQPKIHSGDLVTVSPDIDNLEVGDIVLCKVHGTYYLHLIKAIEGPRYQIANNHGHINGWCTKNGIYGRVTAVEG